MKKHSELVVTTRKIYISISQYILNKMRCKTLVGIGGLVGAGILVSSGLIISTCNKERSKPTPIKQQSTNIILEDICGEDQILEGTIKRVQHSNFGFFFPNGWSCAGGTHEFEYVFVENSEQDYVLIYPFSKPIKYQSAKLVFKPLTKGHITAQEFADLFVHPNRPFRSTKLDYTEEQRPSETYPHNINQKIEGEGIILEIQYK